VTLNQPADAFEGTHFQLTGTILPPYSSFNYSVTGNYGGMQYDPQTGNFSVWILFMDDGPIPEDDTPSDVEEIEVEMQVWASGSPPGSGVSDSKMVTVHNVDPRLVDPDYGDPEDGYLLIDIYDYPPGGPDFIISGFFLDDGTQDEHVVTITWGDGSAPTEFVPEDLSISASHHYKPDGGSYTITVTVEDDDTGFTEHSETISMYRLDLDNDADHDGAIDEDDDPIENVEPGAYVALNGDDDDENGILDLLEEGPISGEDDLEPILIAWSPTYRPHPSVLDYTGWHVVLTLDPPPTWNSYEQEYDSVARLYTSQDKSEFVPFGTEEPYSMPAIEWTVGTDEIPGTLYVEARSAGVFRLQLELRSPGWQLLDTDPVAFTVLPTISVQASNATETGAVAVTVSLSHPVSEQVSVDFIIEEGTATTSDYYVQDLPPGAYTGTITFGALEFSKTILIPAINDPEFEDEEWLRVVLANPVNAILSDQSEALPRILENDPFVTISQDNAGIEPLTEEDQSYATFTIEMLGVEGGPGWTDVTWTTSVATGDTATADNDFESTEGTVTVYYGEPTTVQVPILHDESPEDLETFLVILTGTTNDIVILKDTGSAVILDPSSAPDEEPPPDCPCGEEGARTLTGLTSNKGGQFWEGDEVTFTAEMSSPTPAPNETFAWERRTIFYREDLENKNIYWGWEPFGTSTSATLTHTFSEPWIGQVRVKLTSAPTFPSKPSKVVDVRAKAAYPTGIQVLPESGQVGQHLWMAYEYSSSSGRPADLDGVQMGEFVWYTDYYKWWGEKAGRQGTYPYPPPFTNGDSNGYYLPVPVGTTAPLRFTDHHGEALEIGKAGTASVTAHQYYWYRLTDGFRYLSRNTHTHNNVYLGDPKGYVKLRESTITHSIQQNGTYKIEKMTGGAQDGQMQIVITSWPFTAE